jgi:hypothetical protein
LYPALLLDCLLLRWMATFEITIDDSLAPGIIATASLEGKTPEEVVNEAAAAAATKACQDFKVGPYYTGPITATVQR